MKFLPIDNIVELNIALLHPPYIFHTNRYPIFPVPWSLSHVGSSRYVGIYPIGPHWELEPLGLNTIKNYMESNSNYSVEIINLAYLKEIIWEQMIKQNKELSCLDRSIFYHIVEKNYPQNLKQILKTINADLYAVDLHWLIYSQGAIEILKLIKGYHPNSYTVIGGITASYFSVEIMKSYSFIDFLIEGDGCIPLLELIKQIKGDKCYENVPNLLFRRQGKLTRGQIIKYNDALYVEKDFHTSYNTVPTARGCPLQCITCGGSKYFFKNVYGYNNIHIYSVDSILNKLFHLAKKPSKESPKVFLIHDPFITLGKKKWEILLQEISRNCLNIKLIIEFFLPHSKEDIHKIACAIPGSKIHISPESIDEKARSFHKGIQYSNDSLLMNLDVINNIKELSMGVWFMIGLAKDTKQTIDYTLDFIKNYYKKIKKMGNINKNIIHYTELLYIDPGSLAYHFPKKFGYNLIYNSFKEYIESFIMPIFKYQINYQTKYFDRDQIFNMSLYMHNLMNIIYYENHMISKKLFTRATLYNNLLKKYSSRYDEAITETDFTLRNKKFCKIGKNLMEELQD